MKADMKIVVESGATKTAWRSIDKHGIVRQAQTDGLSPTCRDSEHVHVRIRNAVLQLNPDDVRVDEVIFYGAGLVSEDSVIPFKDAFGISCPFADVSFNSDLLAAARALFGDGSGVVAIMGTGSNSCLYEDGVVVSNIRPGGYVLGDEGSGASLGRAFLADFVKGMLPDGLERDFVRETGLDYPAIVRRVYKEPAASAFMASLAPFVLAHAEDPFAASLIRDCMESFIRRALARYSADASDASVARRIGVVGSFGCACENFLRTAGAPYGLEFVKFVKSPIDELVKYHGI